MNLAAINPNIVMIVIGIILAILLIYLFFQYLSMKNKVNRLMKKYKYFMNGEDGKSIELKLSTEVRELREMLSSSENMLHQQELLATMQLQSYQKTGLVRYDAFDDTGDKLSFSLCLLDGKNDGFVLSSLAGHETCRIYAKKVTSGQCREALSTEEAESIRQALQTLMPDMANQAINAVEQDKMVNATASAMPDDHKIDMAKK
ncbi:DUF4446 family protein [Dialister sp.]|uniref:DUF4446 family protein n=1 Tax=Dialister sp. TaxID=1955814 RepID=UPI002E809E73|nr:DUF4446 family protein [Dialister sp.]MEE3453905.1 DUF4446 family protein [Dialister sp.]